MPTLHQYTTYARTATSIFILTAPLLILAVDMLWWYLFDRDCTITWVIRDWAEESRWPEVIFVVACVLLYFHLFKGWL